MPEGTYEEQSAEAQAERDQQAAEQTIPAEPQVEEVFPHAQVTVLVNQNKSKLYVQTGDGKNMETTDPAQVLQVVEAYLKDALGKDNPLHPHIQKQHQQTA